MFDVGWTELVVITIIACLMLEVKDIPKILKIIRQAFKYFNDLIKDIRQIFHDIEDETTKITDLDGNEHKAYNINDLDDLAADVKNDTRRRKKN